MKTAIPITLVAAALATAPMLASAKHCPSGMKYKKHGYYDQPYYYRDYREYRPMPMPSYYPKHPRAHGYRGEPGMQYPAGRQATGDTAPAVEATENIVDTAVNAGIFNTLVDALNAAGLVETLQGSGPFTVFAPSDRAFAKIPEKIRSAIIADKDALTELLTYHVISDEVSAADVAMLNSAETVQGSAITIDTSNGVKVDGASVTTADIRASNGIIHVIDTVMIPN